MMVLLLPSVPEAVVMLLPEERVALPVKFSA